jgi:hypothetical protein
MVLGSKEVAVGLVVLVGVGLPGIVLIERAIVVTMRGVIRIHIMLIKRELTAVLEWIEQLRLRPRKKDLNLGSSSSD